MDRSLVQYMSLLPLLLKPLKQRVIDVASFRLSKSFYSQSVLFKSTNNFGSVFTNLLNRGIYETKFPTHVDFLFSIFCFSYDFKYSFDVQNRLFPTLAMLLLYLSPVNCRSWKVESKGKLYARSELLLGSSPFWDVTQRRLVVTDVSRQPVGPIF